ncbi:Cleft lip and palate transmembrane protein 1-like [Colletotrichum gloeosporioides]|uniref:Cleft lip and palate transmembrane protein 1-like n=1 Tax=Colletotrichum gloeosporioides TaxID=474922 RepID=A0A8H4CW26_COLGL|nr:Cleft lip and palate transmembrane protein 1-like [Colletotrichum gloeosporioides]KAF3811183.1 Cleft lip and palate transmembrane protein 1-like [Colletotrichum gloeosporioides]
MSQPNAPARPAAPQEEGGMSMTQKLLLGASVYFGMNMLMNNVFQKNQSGTQVKDADGNVVSVPANTEDIPPYLFRPKELNEGATFSQIPHKLAPIWPMDSYVDIIVTVSDNVVPTPLSQTPQEKLVLKEEKFKLGNYSEKRSVDTTIKIPPSVQNNGTLWGHFYVSLPGAQPDPYVDTFDPASAYYFAFPLTQYIPKKKEFKTRSLLDKAEEEPEPVVEEQDAGPIIASYYHPNASLSMIPNTGVLEYRQTHPAIRQFLQLEPTGARDGSGKHSWYYPILFVNTFWQLKSQMMLLNDTVTEVPLHIDLNNLRSWQFNTLAAIEASAKESARQAAYGNSLPGGGDGSEIEMVKEIFIDTNPILLGITVVVSIAHIILETLAFGSDIAHYRKKKDNVGISVRSILANVFMQAVILLYLIDNSTNTSWMILGSQAVGIVIELWKITTVVNVAIKPAPPGSWLPFSVVFEDKHKLSETEEKTKEYDEIAFKYMYIAGVPILLGYAGYSLVYETHKSWYSYVLAVLVSSVYGAGFLMMVPSLYINYRLKSVAHMPAKAMMYKFLNTFIDDLFAFTIKMPFLHRLSTFRDDIIFFIYLYQRYAYKTDYTRVNEFGQGGEDEQETDKEKAKAKELLESDPAVEKVKEIAGKATGADTGKAKKRK